MLFQCWVNVADSCPALKQYSSNFSDFHGRREVSLRSVTSDDLSGARGGGGINIQRIIILSVPGFILNWTKGYISPMLSSFTDGGPTKKQHWLNVWC